jgi:hypothetical protein
MRRALQLQEALGGNSKTSLLVAASPHLDNIEETISTLKFAQRAKTIKNRVVVNEEKSVAELNAIINQLKKENEGLQKYALGLEGALRDAGVDPSTIVIPDELPRRMPSKRGKRRRRRLPVLKGRTRRGGTPWSRFKF